jgi:RNA polymerase sigma factor (sigma-70 family)
MDDGSRKGPLLEHVQLLFSEGSLAGLTDRDLLERFLEQAPHFGDAAFGALVERHGPMVLRVCNQTLGDWHAAEDAFQATFLVLARHARSIRKHDSVQSWLFGVACRAAARIRMMEARRRRSERQGAAECAYATPDAAVPSEAWPELHAEIARLPEKYRVPIVLCYFEGLTHEQAAGRLGWPVGTVKTRLARARAQIRWRLDRLGSSGAALSAIDHLFSSGSAPLPRVLLSSTARAAAHFARQGAAAGFPSTSVMAVARGVLKEMLMVQVKMASVVVLAAVALGAGAFALARQNAAATQAAPQAGPSSAKVPEPSRPTILRLNGVTALAPKTVHAIHPPFECTITKVVVNVGESVKRGDPLVEVVGPELAEAKKAFLAADSRQRLAEVDLTEARNERDPEVKKVFEKFDEVSQRQLKAAREKLVGFGLTDVDIERISREDELQKPRMVLRAPADGVIARRSVVIGNLYDVQDSLLELNEVETLWVTAAIDPRDATHVALGQRVTVSFPFSDSAFSAQVEAVGPVLGSQGGQTSGFRTSIPNRDHRLKPGMLVNMRLELGTQKPEVSPPPAPTRRTAEPTLEERVSELERKLGQLLGERGGQSTNEKILDRLEDVERKLDRALRSKRSD